MIEINNQKLSELYFKIREKLKNGKKFTDVNFVDTSFVWRECYRYELVLNSSKGDLKITVEARLEHSEYINVCLKLNDDDVVLDEKGIKIVTLIADLFKSRKESRINNLIDSVLEDNNKEDKNIFIELEKWEIRFLMDCYKATKDCAAIWPENANVIYDKLEDSLKRL